MEVSQQYLDKFKHNLQQIELKLKDWDLWDIAMHG